MRVICIFTSWSNRHFSRLKRKCYMKYRQTTRVIPNMNLFFKPVVHSHSSYSLKLWEKFHVHDRFCVFGQVRCLIETFTVIWYVELRHYELQWCVIVKKFVIWSELMQHYLQWLRWFIHLKIYNETSWNTAMFLVEESSRVVMWNLVWWYVSNTIVF